MQLSRLDALGDVDFASFTTSALVHGADDDEVMLGLASLPAMVDTWRTRHPTLPPALRRDGRTLLLLASLSAEPQSVQLDTAVLLAPYAVSTHG